jgi:SHS family lactate transporter-like MFS transporter
MTYTPSDAIPLAYQTPPEKSDGHWAALLAGFLGWTLDAFDFFLVTLCLTDIAKEFHKDKKQIALSLTVALMFRPVGAFIFGLMADRYGRRLPLMIDLVFYSVVEVLTGFAPGYVSFMILRALFGIGMGGEWGVGASLAMEKVPPRYRGVLSGLLQEGYAMGFLLAAACYWIVFPRYGWRPLFFIGGLPALTRHHDWASLRKALLSNWKLFLYLTLLMAGMNFSSHGTQDLYPTFLKSDRGFTPQRAAWVTIIMQVGAVIGGVSFGLLSDHIGRRLSIVIAFILAIAMIPLWAFTHTLVLLVAGAFLIQFMVQGAWGVIPAHINELAPDNVADSFPDSPISAAY